MIRALVLAALLAGCGTFEDPTIVLDLRVLAMSAELVPNPGDLPEVGAGPDQVVDVDLTMPMAAQILEQLRPTRLCALAADPRNARDLRWSMTVCMIDEEGRCDPDAPTIDLGSGVIGDPETSEARQIPCATIEPQDTQVGQKLLAILSKTVTENPVQALGGVDYTVVFSIGAVDDRSTDVYASKHLRVSPRIPEARVANTNPRVDYVDAALENGGTIPLPVDSRCSDTFLAPRVPPGTRVTLFPIEPAGVRETYVVPTLDGQVAMLEETMTYQWLATYGGWSDELTGGGHDLLGNQSLLGSDWIAPSEVTGSLMVSLWMIQRDERYGTKWFETCIEVFR
ncbi:MAG: hypothetical protein JWP01_2094 [Myxococcales bacterium]|nr:hypothetical protein [Myxococcales bacterium]